MRIVVNDQVHLSEFQASDKPALVHHPNDRDIYDRTLRIPFPNTDAVADEWLERVLKITMEQGRHFLKDDKFIDARMFALLKSGHRLSGVEE